MSVRVDNVADSVERTRRIFVRPQDLPFWEVRDRQDSATLGYSFLYFCPGDVAKIVMPGFVQGDTVAPDPNLTHQEPGTHRTEIVSAV